MGWEDLFIKIGTGILGNILSGLTSQGLNMAFAPSPPSRRDIQRDLQMQAETMRGAAQPIRTREQEESDKLAVEATRARQATFSGLSKEYAGLQAAGPKVFWDPYVEDRIRTEAMAEAAVQGMAESGQAQQHVSRRLDEYRLKASQGAAGFHESQLSNLRQQMLPYSGVEAPGQAQTPPVPQATPIPRDIRQPFTSSPVNIGAVFDEGQADEKKKKEPENAWNTWDRGM